METRHSVFGLLCITAAMVLVGEGCFLDAGSCNVISTGNWTAFNNPYGDGGVNPLQNVVGAVYSCPASPGDTLRLSVTGLPTTRQFGSHLHLTDCATNNGSGHYRFDPDAGASATNEVWLDIMTDPTGTATSVARTARPIPAGAAKSIILHDRATDSAGAAGPKLTCINVSL